MPLENIEYLLDTFAWIEYFVGSKKGKIVKNLIDSETIYTSIITIAELSDKYYRENLVDKWNDRYKFILSKSYILQMSIEIAKKSGPRKWQLRESHENIGLADAIIIETASQKNLTIVSGDPHFEDLDNVFFLD